MFTIKPLMPERIRSGSESHKGFVYLNKDCVEYIEKYEYGNGKTKYDIGLKSGNIIYVDGYSFNLEDIKK